MYAIADPLIAEQAHNLPWPNNVTIEMFNQINWVSECMLCYMSVSPVL